MSGSISRVTVLGAGTMGHGIAHVAAQAGYDTCLFDVAAEALEKGLNQVKANLDKGVAKGKVTAEDAEATLQRLRGATDLADAVGQADLVVEAVPEVMALKQSVFNEVVALAPAHVILGSNTSSLSLSEIAAAVPRPERVIGMHFFNPPHIVKLLEIIKADQTSPEVLEVVREVGERMDRELVVVRDSPGFASSRLGLVLGLEAIRMVEQGVATAEDIDKAMVHGYRHPMGPLKLTDLVGLDVRLKIADYLYEKLGTETFKPPELLRKMVDEGKLGKKSGEGFYCWL
jgi:3-hydroxybutyryl-CoA dehydrogenase